MNDFYLTEDKIALAKKFFLNSSINVLTKVSIEINQEQPNFTAVLLALEMHGLDRIRVEDLLESVFIIYCAQTRLNKKSIPEISYTQIAKNINWITQFIGYYNDEKTDGFSDLSQIKFLRDDVVLNFALGVLQSLFIDSKSIPKEVAYGYFALLKGIEMGAEKSTKGLS